MFQIVYLIRKNKNIGVIMIKNARYKSDFLYEINGLIDGEFIYFKTDSKKVVNKLLELMDDAG